MKQLTCEMCGSTDLMKQEGVFVCQTCGMKYSIEEAKKMMIEGTVDVQGTVQVDNSAFVEKYLANARRAKQKEDWEETEKYYNMVEQNDPTNIEAIFYSSYGKAKRSLVDADIFKRQATFKVLQNCVSIIDDNFDINKEAEQKEIIYRIKSDILAMACSSYVYNTTTTQYGTTTDKNKTESLFVSLIDEFIKTIDNIIPKYTSIGKEKSIYLYEMMIELHSFQIQNMGLTRNAKNLRRDRIITIHERIHAIDPSHVVPARTDSSLRAVSNSGNGSTVFSKMLIAGMSTLLFGAFMFLILGEAEYFMLYMGIRGFYDFINVLFVLDYICIGIGAIGTMITLKAGNNNVSISSILGIAGFAFAWLFAIAGHGLAIAGIILGVKEEKATGKKDALWISSLAEICAIVSSLMGIIAMM